MISTLISALLPVVVTLMLGYYAGFRQDFNGNSATEINKLVMSYTLPLSLFGGIVATNGHILLQNVQVALWIFIGMVGGYLIVLLVLRYLFKNSLSLAALRTLAITGPAIPFVGPTVLGALFPDKSALLVSIGGLVMNIIQVPLTVILLSSDSDQKISLGTNLKNAFKKPVVWAPILAFILVMCGLTISPDWERCFSVLGQATGGLALFSSGIVLFEKKPKLSLPVWGNTLTKIVIIPAVMYLLMKWCQVAPQTLKESLVSLGIPTAAICTIFANQYNLAEREMASTLFLSTVLSVITLGFIIVFLGI